MVKGILGVQTTAHMYIYIYICIYMEIVSSHLTRDVLRGPKAPPSLRTDYLEGQATYWIYL